MQNKITPDKKSEILVGTSIREQIVFCLTSVNDREPADPA